MRVQYIIGPSVVIEAKGAKVLCDPWLTDGAYYGSWYHFPPPQLGPSDFADIDYIYVSHAHPDHFDATSLREFSKATPIIILDYEAKYFLRGLQGLGFEQIIEIKHGERKQLSPDLWVELFAAHLCETEGCGIDSTCGQWLDADGRSKGVDSTAVFQGDNQVIINHNDTPYFAPLCDLILSKYHDIDLDLASYNGAGSYPQCSDNLSNDEKMVQADRKKIQFSQMVERWTRHLQARWVLPFAGQYTLVGNLSELNPYRGVSTVAEVGEYLRAHKGQPMSDPVSVFTERRRLFSNVVNKPLVTEPVLFSGHNQGAWFDLSTGEQSEAFIPEKTDEERDYISGALQYKQLDYQQDFYIAPRFRTNLIPLLKLASREMHTALIAANGETLAIIGEWHLYLDVDQSWLYQIDMRNPDVRTVLKGEEIKPFLRIRLDYSFLMMLLTRHANWITAEIGSHLSYYRDPDVHERALTRSLSLLHI